MSSGDEGNDGGNARDWRTPLLITLGVLVVILLGTIVGFVVSGGLDDGTPAESANGTTVPTTPLTTAPLATGTTSPTDTAPSATLPPALGVPDFSVEGQITYTASEDTYTDSLEPEDINGYKPVIELENDSPDFKLGLIRFQITDIPDGQTVGSAFLQLALVSPPDQPVSVHAVQGDWAEMEVTAANAPQIGAAIATIPAGGAYAQVVQVDISSVVAGNGQLDLYLATSSDSTIEFSSKEGDEGPPRLTVILGA